MMLDLERLRAAPLCRDPFDFVIVDEFIRARDLPALLADFPAVRRHGSFPLGALACGAAFGALAAELEGDELRREIERKFAIDLAGRPTMITVRGMSDGKDGRIHTDSPTKLITLLLYMTDCAAEVAPLAGAMVAFRRSAASFHGHYPHRGERRALQLNWVTDESVVRRELGRHAWSARLKALNPFG
jgi:SM-20-related protein